MFESNFKNFISILCPTVSDFSLESHSIPSYTPFIYLLRQVFTKFHNLDAKHISEICYLYTNQVYIQCILTVWDPHHTCNVRMCYIKVHNICTRHIGGYIWDPHAWVSPIYFIVHFYVVQKSIFFFFFVMWVPCCQMYWVYIWCTHMHRFHQCVLLCKCCTSLCCAKIIFL
jgi:hypothetical protein